MHFLLVAGNDNITDTNFCGKTWTSTSDIEKPFTGIMLRISFLLGTLYRKF